MSLTDEPKLKPMAAMRHLVAGVKIAETLWAASSADARIEYDSASYFFRYWQHIGSPDLLTYEEKLFKVRLDPGTDGEPYCYVEQVSPYGLIDETK